MVAIPSNSARFRGRTSHIIHHVLETIYCLKKRNPAFRGVVFIILNCLLQKKIAILYIYNYTNHYISLSEILGVSHCLCCVYVDGNNYSNNNIHALMFNYMIYK